MRNLRSYTPAVVLAASLLLTLTATSLVLATGRARARARFESAVRATRDRVTTRMDTYSAILRGASGLFAAGPVSQTEFRAYAAQLDIRHRYPGIQGIGFSKRLSARGQDSLSAGLRTSGRSSFPVWPDSARDQYYPTIYLEPRDRRNEPAIGFDMFTEPTRRLAMERARDSGLPSVSGKVILVQDPDGYQQTGFLMYFPVYRQGQIPPSVAERRAALEGFVFSPFRSDDVFAGIFGSERHPDVGFRVYDGPRAAPENLLHDSRLTVGGSRDTTDQSGSSSIIIAGRMWTLGFVSLADDWIRRMLAPAMALFGLVVSFVLYVLTRSEVLARKAAERSEAVRARFYAAMSHELRTPLNAVIGYNQLLLEGIYGPLEKKHETGIERSQKAAKHLLELVNDVLDLSKIEAGKIDVQIESVDIPALMEDLFTTIKPMAEASDSEVTLVCEDCGNGVQTDPRRVRQIVLNLLSNATKFGSGKPITVRCTKAEGDGVLVSVTDQGSGIPDKELHRIFEEFVQMQSVKLGGTGLGLPISRRLAEVLGGRLEVESKVGAGSTFRLFLPKEAPLRKRVTDAGRNGRRSGELP
ncbi:MAG: CHASE domain-containing protein [Anaerolineae bacterium]|nr:CHASE domain-containing protein [Gemmatimonadaceae bacterium]